MRLFKKQKADINENKQNILDDWFEFLKTSQEGLETCEADIKDLGNFIPPGTNERLKDMKDLVKTTLVLCDAIKESGECLDFEGFYDTMAEFKKAFNEKKTATDTQVKTAKTLKK